MVFVTRPVKNFKSQSLISMASILNGHVVILVLTSVLDNSRIVASIPVSAYQMSHHFAIVSTSFPSSLNVFKLDGKDIETISKWWDIWWELTGVEYTTLEQSKTIFRTRITRCPWITKYKDISDWDLKSFGKRVAKTINPRMTVEQHRNRCAGDSNYCEFVFKIED